MSNNTKKVTIAQDSISQISISAPKYIQNSIERISVCAPISRSLSKIATSLPNSGSTNASHSTGTISSCAPKSNK